MKLTLKEWSGARARVEIEGQRKQEHINSATKFAESRAFKRSNMKSKNFNHEDNPLLGLSSSSSSDDEAIEIKNITNKAMAKGGLHLDSSPVVVMDRNLMLSPS